MKRKLLATLAAILAVSGQSLAADPSDWQAVEKIARGQTVYFNAWGGAQNINDYIVWAGDQVKRKHGVTVIHVKLDDTANAVAKVVAEKAAGTNEGGSIDLPCASRSGEDQAGDEDTASVQLRGKFQTRQALSVSEIYKAYERP